MDRVNSTLGAGKRRMQGQPVIFLVTIIITWSVARVGAHYRPDDFISAPRLVSQNETAQKPHLSEKQDGTGQINAGAILYSRLQGIERPIASSGHVLQYYRRLPSGAAGEGERRKLAHSGFGVMANQSSIPQPLYAVRAGDPTPEHVPAKIGNPGVGSMGLDSPLAASAARHASKWSLYAWAHYRSGDAPAALAGNASYGGSQAGAILRYWPWNSSRFAPALVLRATAALQTQQQMLAFGASMQPVANVPVTSRLEYRQSLDGNSRNGVAAELSGGFYSDRLPGGFALNSFGQAGVIGVSDPDFYFDVQMVGERRVTIESTFNLKLGAGVWAGGQTDSAAPNDPFTYRVDMGPHARVALPVVHNSASLAIDWRQRVAGNAAPGSGLTLTLAADF